MSLFSWDFLLPVAGEGRIAASSVASPVSGSERFLGSLSVVEGGSISTGESVGNRNGGISLSEVCGAKVDRVNMSGVMCKVDSAWELDPMLSTSIMLTRPRFESAVGDTGVC